MSCTRSYNPLCVSTFNPTPMANNYQGSTFPTPPSLRARSVRPVSLISARNDKDYALESSPLHLGRSNSQRSSGTHDLATQSDIRRVLEYLMHMRQDLDAEKRKREEDVSALRNQSQEMYDGFTATSRRQHERASAFKTLMQDHTRKVEKLQNRASALDTSMEEVQLQMQEVAKQVQSDKLRKMMNVMPLGSHGKSISVQSGTLQTSGPVSVAEPSTSTG